MLNVHCRSFMYYLLSVIMCPPPRSTLFPYTTLFRSITYAKDASAASAVVKAIERDGGKAIAIQADAADANAVKAAVEKTFATDRKSTRLNSSHRCISYAVFCLKKKR